MTQGSWKKTPSRKGGPDGAQGRRTIAAAIADRMEGVATFPPVQGPSLLPGGLRRELQVPADQQLPVGTPDKSIMRCRKCFP